MALSAVLFCLLATIVLSPASAQQQGSCAACNCPVDTYDDLDAYIATKINEVMGNEPRK